MSGSRIPVLSQYDNLQNFKLQFILGWKTNMVYSNQHINKNYMEWRIIEFEMLCALNIVLCNHFHTHSNKYLDTHRHMFIMKCNKIIFVILYLGEKIYKPLNNTIHSFSALKICVQWIFIELVYSWVKNKHVIRIFLHSIMIKYFWWSYYFPVESYQTSLKIGEIYNYIDIVL